MAAGTTPIYTATPRVSWTNTDGNGGAAGPLKTANTAHDGTGTVLTVFTAGANGSFINTIRFQAAGTNTASVARIFINNGSANSTLGNNVKIDEVTLAATTASAVAETTLVEVTLNKPIPAGYTVIVTIGTTVSAGYNVSVFGGDY
jgi:hypothetical protein